ncbi:hypothetical protein MTO96_031423 [Rhipicephalus appendiculatus]
MEAQKTALRWSACPWSRHEDRRMSFGWCSTHQPSSPGSRSRPLKSASSSFPTTVHARATSHALHLPLGPPHELSWTDPSANASWCDRGVVDTLLQAMRTRSGHPTPEVTRAFYPEFKVVAVELHYRGACTDRRGIAPFPIVATAIGAVLAAALIAGLVLWRALRLVPSRSRKLNVTSRSSAVPRESFHLKQRRPVLLTGENRAGSTNGTPSKSPHTKPNPPFVVDTDFCYINPNFLEVVKQSPPPPPPYRKSLDRRSLDAVLPAPPPRPPHGPHSSLGSRRRAEHDEGSSSSGVESDAQPSGRPNPMRAAESDVRWQSSISGTFQFSCE